MQRNKNFNRNAEIPFVMSYDDFENIREQMNARRYKRLNRDRAKRAEYYRRQRKMGMNILFVGVAVLALACLVKTAIMAYFGGIVGLAGLYTVLTKRMILVDRYYFERQDRINEY